jgi:Skp family chaperone for outer membrane proteins
MSGRARRLVALGLGVVLGQAAGLSAGVAQQQPGPVANTQVELRSPVVTLDRDRLFAESMMGKAMQAQIEEASAALIAENRRLEAALEAEEQALTDRRPTMPAEEFRAMAAEFDTRVEELRTAQDAKSRALSRQVEQNRQKFFDAALPVLGGLMLDIKAVAILDRSAVILTFDQLDVTDLAIARMDRELGSGADAAEPPPAEAAPAPEASAPQAPAPEIPVPETPAPETAPEAPAPDATAPALTAPAAPQD